MVQLVEAPRYTPEGREFHSRWALWDFSLTQSFRPHYGPGIDSVSNKLVPGSRCVRTTLPPSLQPWVESRPHASATMDTERYKIRSPQWGAVLLAKFGQLPSSNPVLLERPTGLRLVKKFPALHGIRQFIIAFTRAHHLSLS